MNKGMVRFLFDNGQQFTVEIGVPHNVELQKHEVWRKVKDWWLYSGSQCFIAIWDDGSEILLNRNNVTSIIMLPKEILEIE